MKSNRSFLSAVTWSYASSWGERAFTALFTFVLAALLGPREFGVLSLALIYLGFLQLFLDQGLSTALVQRKSLEPEHLDTVFWTNIVISLLLVAVSFALNRSWGEMNHSPEVVSVITFLTLSIPIEALAIVQKAILMRDMDFKSLSIRSNVAVLAGGGVGVGMAYAGFGVWSLVGQQLVRDAIALCLVWRLSRWRPRARFSWAHLKELTGVATATFVAQLGLFTENSLGSILLGLLFGPVAVGLFRFADRLVSTVVSVATSSIQSVSLPAFSRLQHDPLELKNTAMSCIRLSAVVTLPALAGLAAVTPRAIAAVGSQWLPAGDVLRVLCVSGMIFIFAFFTGPLLQACGRSKELAGLEWARTALGIIILLLTAIIVRHASSTVQILGIAVARFITISCFITPVFVWILLRLTGISFLRLLAAIAPAVVCSASVVLAVEACEYWAQWSHLKPITILIAEVLIAGITGLCILLSADRQLRTVVGQFLEPRLPVYLRATF